MNFIRGLFQRFKRPDDVEAMLIARVATIDQRLERTEKILRTDEANADLVQSNRALTQSFAELEARAAGAEATNATLRKAYQDCKDARGQDAGREKLLGECAVLFDWVLAPQRKRPPGVNHAEIIRQIKALRIKL